MGFSLVETKGHGQHKEAGDGLSLVVQARKGHASGVELRAKSGKQLHEDLFTA
jgi:hypothetical protein